ncbi:hypothetical protein V8C44DRAFT_353127 [Trichoderma aethiopicum]
MFSPYRAPSTSSQHRQAARTTIPSGITGSEIEQRKSRILSEPGNVEQHEEELVTPLCPMSSPHSPQKPRPTAPTSGRPALQNPSGQPGVESPKSSDYVPKSGQGRGEGGSTADGTAIKSSSGPSIGPKQHLKPPEAKVPQTFRMSGENIPSDTNNDGTQVNVRPPQAMQTGHQLYVPPGTGAQTDGQNPNLPPEEMKPSGSEPLVFGSHRLTPLAQLVNTPDGAGERQAHSTRRDESSDVGQVQHLSDTSTDNGSETGTEPPVACQSSNQETELPSAVDCSHAGEENPQASPQPQQGRHPNKAASGDSPSTMHPPRAGTNSSVRLSKKDQPSNQPSHKALVEPASWSQSKRWISSETKERKAFQRMMLNLQFMKADQSPFVPKTPAELTKFKISLAEAKRQKLAQEVSVLEEKNRQKELAKAAGTMSVAQPHVPLLHGRDMEDELSPVFAVHNCFNKQDTVEVNKRVEWPSLAELKEDGDRRAKCGRFLPLPRIKVTANQAREKEQAHAPNGDGAIL